MGGMGGMGEGSGEGEVREEKRTRTGRRGEDRREMGRGEKPQGGRKGRQKRGCGEELREGGREEINWGKGKKDEGTYGKEGSKRGRRKRRE